MKISLSFSRQKRNGDAARGLPSEQASPLESQLRQKSMMVGILILNLFLNFLQIVSLWTTNAKLYLEALTQPPPAELPSRTSGDGDRTDAQTELPPN
jgi:hypothetical protein